MKYIALVFISLVVPGFSFRVSADDEITLFSSSLYEGNQSHSGPLAVSLSVKEPVVITKVGAFESNAKAPFLIQVAIYDKNTKEIVEGSRIYEITRENSEQESNYRFTSIGKITLNPGSYMLVAQGYNNDQQNGNENIGGKGPAMNGGDIIFVEASYWDFGAMSYPNTADPKQNPYHAANIKFKAQIQGSGSIVKTSPGLRTTR